MTKKMLLLLSFALVLGQIPGGAEPAAVQSDQKPSWASTEEYNSWKAAFDAKDPHKKIELAEAFMKGFPKSAFVYLGYVEEMKAYQQLGQGDKAFVATAETLKLSPDNLDALRYEAFLFPFVFKSDDPDATAKLSRVASDAKHGLEILGKEPRPQNVTEEQFNQYIKGQRANFNNAVGFADLKQKDYAGALTSLKAAAEDNPSDNLTFNLLGQAYLYSSPPDFDHAIWYLARSVALAKAGNNPNATALEKFYGQVYVGRHGSDAGQNDVVTQAAAAVDPPDGFKVLPPEKHAKTGNPNVDGFYEIEDGLRLGGDQAQKFWDGLKGQPLGLNGFVDNVEKGSDPDTYLVRVDITDESRAKDGVYDIELKDSQSEAKNLSKGDPVRFQGTIASYTITPSFVLSLDNAKINDDDLAAATAKAKTKPKPKPRARTTTHRPVRKKPPPQ